MIIKVGLGSRSYDILLQSNVLEKIGKIIDLKRKVLILTDSGVPKEYSQNIALQCKEPVVISVCEGEKSKSIEAWQSVLKKMLEENFTRHDCVVAVGGGVVGDLAGFCAASYMRGIDFYNIPTTLLSQVDSSVGGKTAVNFCGVKNIVGAFYQPKKVVIDFNVLKTLDKRQLSCGLAEAIKMAVCFDEKLFALMENEDMNENLPFIIENSLKIKRDVVQKDEKEGGLRKALNFGHTIGHGIEAQGNLYHGECVALGMLPFCSEEVRKRLEKVLLKANLSTACHENSQKIIDALKHDKKMNGEFVDVVRVDKIGSFRFEKMALNEIEKIVRENY